MAESSAPQLAVVEVPFGLLTVIGRENTFNVAHTVTSKRRESSTSKKKTVKVTTAKWPHKVPDIKALARAGFYYHPVPESSDNVRCFTCGSNLDGWEAGDDPATEHVKHAPQCAWAIHLAIAQRMEQDEDELDGEQDPMSDLLVQARTATFRDQWPHENKKGWKVKVKQLVNAGWCYDPTDEYEDGVKCFYCSLALDGWDPKDDPSKEHTDRRDTCPFFELKDKFAEEKKLAKSKASKGAKPKAARAGRTSKASNARMSVDSVAFSEMPSMMSLGDDGHQLNDSMLSTTSTATTKRATAAKGKKKAANNKKPPSKSKVDKSEIDLSALTRSQENNESLYPDLSLAMDDASKTNPDLELPATYETGAEANIDSQSQQELAPKPKRKGKKTAQSAAVADPPAPDAQANATTDEIDDGQVKTEAADEGEVSFAPSEWKGWALVTGGGRTSTAEDEIHALIEAASDLTPNTGRMTRGRKRDSNGTFKNESSILVFEGTPDRPPTKATKGRKKAKISEEVTAAASASEELPSVIDAPEPSVKQTKKALPKGRKGKKAATPPPASPEQPVQQVLESHITTEMEMVAEPEVQDPVVQLSDTQVEEMDVEPTPEPEVQPRGQTEALQMDDIESGRSVEPPIQATPVPSVHAASPAPDTPTPIRTTDTRRSAHNQTPLQLLSSARARQSLPKRAPKSPSSSPQSSDAENKPPSSRPSAIKGALFTKPTTHTQTVPLAVSTPQTSPSKVNGTQTLVGGVQSAIAWEPADIESVFLASPVKQAYAADANIGSIDLTALAGGDAKVLQTIVDKVRAGMGNEEMGMSVEQWIKWNAGKGEEKLRRDCEALVMAFEKEGRRAMAVLESVEAT